MTSLRRIIGLPVVIDGQNAGHVLRGVPTKDGKKLRGIVVSLPIRGNRWLPQEQIELLGKVSVIASGDTKKMPRDANFRLFRVSSSDGTRVGIVSDAVIEENTKEVLALEISAGPVDDLISGRWFATAFQVHPSLFGDTGHVTIPEEVKSNA